MNSLPDDSKVTDALQRVSVGETAAFEIVLRRYASGETVEGLFIQDALDDGHYVDPVFIADLPEKE